MERDEKSQSLLLLEMISVERLRNINCCYLLVWKPNKCLITYRALNPNTGPWPVKWFAQSYLFSFVNCWLSSKVQACYRQASLFDAKSRAKLMFMSIATRKGFTKDNWNSFGAGQKRSKRPTVASPRQRTSSSLSASFQNFKNQKWNCSQRSWTPACSPSPLPPTKTTRPSVPFETLFPLTNIVDQATSLINLSHFDFERELGDGRR
jgi:hypothetical protein